jgi:hypothetical protein
MERMVDDERFFLFCFAYVCEAGNRTMSIMMLIMLKRVDRMAATLSTTLICLWTLQWGKVEAYWGGDYRLPQP